LPTSYSTHDSCCWLRLQPSCVHIWRSPFLNSSKLTPSKSHTLNIPFYHTNLSHLPSPRPINLSRYGGIHW
jgi:hypothetical protein